MTPTVAALAVAFSSTLGLPTISKEVSPEVKHELTASRPGKVTKPNAVLLVHGLKLHLIRTDKTFGAELQDWQLPGSAMVKELAKDFDVYSFAYAQSAPVDAVASSEGLRARVAALKAAGYRKIVLIGHSAGGIVVRQFVERHPDSGVTKIIQVATPNEGATLADIRFGLPKPQLGFIRSLAPEPRKELCKACTTPVPKGVEFCVVVCKYGRFQGDTIVDVASQWPEDLQKLGVPAVLVSSSHNNAIKDAATITEIGTLVRGRLTRWTDAEVAEARKVLFDSGTKTGFLPKVMGLLKERIGLDRKK
ncbi:MAG TPA: alpha/beta fold hydrolase [Fimbriiglobus sp.]|jgi:pimeloyl-ACP methyl ester carboxylesterase